MRQLQSQLQRPEACSSGSPRGVGPGVARLAPLLCGSCRALAAGGRLAAGIWLVNAVKDGNRQTVRQLLRTRVSVDAAEPDGTTPLHWAIRAGDLETAKLLIAAGATASVANRYGVTPLALAATNGDAAAIQLLLDAGADANTTSSDGETVLMTAARTGRVEAARALLVRGANVNAAETFMGETALMWAAAEGHAAMVKLLAEAGASLNARLDCAAVPEDHVQRQHDGIDPAAARRHDGTADRGARELACGRARARRSGRRPESPRHSTGTTPLIMAIVNRHNDVAALLIEKGADSERRRCDGHDSTLRRC